MNFLHRLKDKHQAGGLAEDIERSGLFTLNDQSSEARNSIE